MMRRWKLFCAMGCVAALVIGASSTTWNAYRAGQTTGTRVTSDGSRLTFVESALTHPTHADGFVDIGDPVLIGDMGVAGVCLQSATAATDYVVVELGPAIWNLTITNTAAMAAGDEVYLSQSAATLSDDAEGGVFFGRVLTAISTTGSGVVRAVLVGNNAVTFVGQNGEVYENSTDGAIDWIYNDDVVQTAWDFHNTNTGTADDDNHILRWYCVNSGAADIQNAYINPVFTDVTTGTEDSRIDIGAITAGTLADVAQFDGVTGIYTAVGVKIGAAGTQKNQETHGTVTIAQNATSATITLATVDANDVVALTIGSDGVTSGVYYAIDAGVDIDVILCGTTSQLGSSEGPYTISYVVYED